MLERDLKTYAFIGRGLWPDPVRSSAMAVETLSAVFLLDLTEERAIDRAAGALLERAQKQSSAATTMGALDSNQFNAFFKLFPEERFLLMALHQGRWSYARLARVMKETPERIEQLAWKARIRLAASVGMNSIGGKLATSSCPEYNMDRPWTQRFLDEEIPSGRELLFLRNHIMACDSCLQTMTRTRNIYFKVESLLPKLEEEQRILSLLDSVSRFGLKTRSQIKPTFKSSVLAVLNKSDVQFVLAIMVFCVLAAILRKIQ